MGDKDDNLFNGKAQLAIFIPKDEVLKPIGTAVDGVSFESEKQLPCNPGKDSFLFSCEVEAGEDARKSLFAEVKPLKIAESMREEINDLIKTYGLLRREGKLNRRERREWERDFKKKLGRFRAFCKENNIRYDIKK